MPTNAMDVCATEEEVRADLAVAPTRAREAFLQLWLEGRIIAFRQADGPLLYAAKETYAD